jgi:hypothetical protein
VERRKHQRRHWHRPHRLGGCQSVLLFCLDVMVLRTAPFTNALECKHSGCEVNSRGTDARSPPLSTATLRPRLRPSPMLGAGLSSAPYPLAAAHA